MGLPKRWLPYSKFGSQIPGTRFVAFKCPLRPMLCSSLPENKQLTPSLLMQYLPSLRMIIDLTFTTKYYTPEEFQHAGLRHVKVMCAGHNLPDTRVIHTFFDEVDTFLQNEPEGLIGVHCTHGVNRTGFLICKYMIAKLGFQPQDAITAFGKARGHLIERKNYLSGLGVPEAELEELVGQQPEDERAPPQVNIRVDRDHRPNYRDRYSELRNRERRHGAPTDRWERIGPRPQNFEPRSRPYGQQQWAGRPPPQHNNNWRRDDRNVPHGSCQPRFDHHQHQRGSYRPPSRGSYNQQYSNRGGPIRPSRDQYDRRSRGNSRDNSRWENSRRNDYRWDDRQKGEGMQPARPLPDLLQGMHPTDY